jgi:hypothetical protein
MGNHRKAWLHSNNGHIFKIFMKGLHLTSSSAVSLYTIEGEVGKDSKFLSKYLKLFILKMPKDKWWTAPPNEWAMCGYLCSSHNIPPKQWPHPQLSHD